MLGDGASNKTAIPLAVCDIETADLIFAKTTSFAKRERSSWPLLEFFKARIGPERLDFEETWSPIMTDERIRRATLGILMRQRLHARESSCEAPKPFEFGQGSIYSRYGPVMILHPVCTEALNTFNRIKQFSY
jgi:hypothetical protein